MIDKNETAFEPDVEGIVADELLFIEREMRIRYLFDRDRNLFLDPRFKVRDVMMLIYFLCEKYSISMEKLSEIDNVVTINGIAKYLYKNWDMQNGKNSGT